MKEVTYEDWQKNPTPRMMWVWDGNENNKNQSLVKTGLRLKLFQSGWKYETMNQRNGKSFLLSLRKQ